MTQTLHRVFERAGVPKAPMGRNGWHRLRHTAATLLDAHGASVATIGMILGHKRGSATTLRYITPDVERAREAMARVSKAVRSAEG